MQTSMKGVLGSIAALFVLVLGSIGFLSIWDVIDQQTAKDAFVRSCYTFLTILILVFAISFIVNVVKQK